MLDVKMDFEGQSWRAAVDSADDVNFMVTVYAWTYITDGDGGQRPCWFPEGTGTWEGRIKDFSSSREGVPSMVLDTLERKLMEAS